MRNWLLCAWIILSLSAITLKAADDELTPMESPLAERPIDAKFAQAIADHNAAVEAAKAKITVFNQQHSNDVLEVRRLTTEVKAAKKLVKRAAEEDKAGEQKLLDETQANLDSFRASRDKNQTDLETAKTDLTKAQTDLATSEAAHAKAADTKTQLNQLRGKLNDMNLMSKFDTLMIEGLTIDDTISALERKLDQSIMAVYMREKMTRVLASDALCKAQEMCGKKMSSADRMKALENSMGQSFHDNKGELGRHRETGDHEKSDTEPVSH